MPPENNQQDVQDPAPQGDQQPQNETFEAWLGQQPDDVRGRYEQHTSGLRSALESERETRRNLERQIRTAARQQEEGSTARQQLEQIAGQLSEQNHRADFYEEAHRNGVTDLRLAYLAARDAGLIDDRGRVDMNTLRTRYPHLFETRRVAPAGNAGNGTGVDPKPQSSMNTFIRRSAGRG